MLYGLDISDNDKTYHWIGGFLSMTFVLGLLEMYFFSIPAIISGEPIFYFFSYIFYPVYLLVDLETPDFFLLFYYFPFVWAGCLLYIFLFGTLLMLFKTLNQSFYKIFSLPFISSVMCFLLSMIFFLF